MTRKFRRKKRFVQTAMKKQQRESEEMDLSPAFKAIKKLRKDGHVSRARRQIPMTK